MVVTADLHLIDGSVEVIDGLVDLNALPGVTLHVSTIIRVVRQ
ncbi:hypothetical protein [Haloglycomyces albus]|nr:hypothetical protein [Haloglycomyces albus]